MLKSARVTFKFKAKNDFFKEILNIEYQSGGYSIFKSENPSERHSNSKPKMKKFEYRISIWLIFDMQYPILIWWIFNIQYPISILLIFDI